MVETERCSILYFSYFLYFADTHFAMVDDRIHTLRRVKVWQKKLHTVDFLSQHLALEGYLEGHTTFSGPCAISLENYWVCSWMRPHSFSVFHNAFPVSLICERVLLQDQWCWMIRYCLRMVSTQGLTTEPVTPFRRVRRHSDHLWWPKMLLSKFHMILCDHWMNALKLERRRSLFRRNWVSYSLILFVDRTLLQLALAVSFQY